MVHWWSAEPERISRAAAKALGDADELAIAAISWFELAWLAEHERIVLAIPVRSWLDQLAAPGSDHPANTGHRGHAPSPSRPPSRGILPTG